MRIFIFKSEKRNDLGAFASDPDRHRLPSTLGPWVAVGVVHPDNAPPHRLDRAVIEKAIESQGYQLFRHKAKVAAAT
jgi:hypothetical protein